MKTKLCLFLAMICVFFSLSSRADITVTNNSPGLIYVQFIGEGSSKNYTMPANHYGYNLVIPASDFKWNCPYRYCVILANTVLNGNAYPLFRMFTTPDGNTILNIENLETMYQTVKNSENSITLSEIHTTH